METTNHGNRSGRKKGQSQGGQGTLKQAGDQVSRKMSDMRDEMADYMSQGSQQFGRLTQGHEGQAVLVALAAGFGIGFVIGCAFASANRRPQTWRERMMAEGIGRKFMNQLEHILPDTITEHFGK